MSCGDKWKVVEEDVRAAGKPIHARAGAYRYDAHSSSASASCFFFPSQRSNFFFGHFFRTENLDRAMSQLRAFAANYPPNDVRTPPPKPHFRSTRTSLVEQCTLIRMTGVTEVPDDNVSPLMTL